MYRCPAGPSVVLLTVQDRPGVDRAVLYRRPSIIVDLTEVAHDHHSHQQGAVVVCLLVREILFHLIPAAQGRVLQAGVMALKEGDHHQAVGIARQELQHELEVEDAKMSGPVDIRKQKTSIDTSQVGHPEQQMEETEIGRGEEASTVKVEAEAGTVVFAAGI